MRRSVFFVIALSLTAGVVSHKTTMTELYAD
jgi:hypothetical protein